MRKFCKLRTVFSTTGMVALLALALALSARPAQAQTRLGLVSTPWSPFTNEQGKARVALDLVHTALSRIGVSAETTIVSESELNPSLLRGDYDGSAALWRDDERERVLLYSRPYLENRLVLVGRTGTDVNAATFAALRGKRLALVSGYSYGDAVNASPGPTIVGTLSEEDSLQKVLANQADYTLMDQLVVESIVKNYPVQARARLAIAPNPLLIRPLYLAIQRSIPNAAMIIERFNDVLRSMIEDRTYHRLLQVDWIEADIDGDGITEYIPRDDKAGTEPPDRGYALLSTTPLRTTRPAPRFYLGGRVYPNWSNVPQSYKVPLPGGTFSPGTEIPIFSFSW